LKSIIECGKPLFLRSRGDKAILKRKEMIKREKENF